MWGGVLDVHPKSGQLMFSSCLSIGLLWEFPSPCLTPSSLSPLDPKALDVYNFFLQWIGEWYLFVIGAGQPGTFPPLSPQSVIHPLDHLVLLVLSPRAQ